MLRVLHEFGPGVDAGALSDEVARLRDQPGCVSAELYRSLATGEDALAAVQLWQTEAAYSAWWAGVLPGLGEASPYPALAGAVTGDAGGTEFYRRTPFVLREGVWVPEDADPAARIVWPAHGEVRIIITTAVAASDAMYAKIAAEIAETRREEGCLSYAWYESVELPGHLLLLEAWAHQVIYDRHWAMRGWTAGYTGDNLRTPATPQRGEVSREFYRREVFRHHYDRWLPADPADYATTIVYPAS